LKRFEGGLREDGPSNVTVALRAMLPTPAVSLSSGPPAGKDDKSLRALFCGAANHLTQLYMSSLKMEKGAIKKGYCRAIEDMVKFLQIQLHQPGRNMSIAALVEHLKTKKREIMERDEAEFSDDDEEQEGSQGAPTLGQTASGRPSSGDSFASSAPFGSATPRSQFGEQLAPPGRTAFASPNHCVTGVLTSGPASSTASALHFGFSSNPAPLRATASAMSSGQDGTASLSTSTSAPFSEAAVSTFREAVNVSFTLAPSSDCAASPVNPFTPLGSTGGGGNGNGRKRQFFEFFFDAPPAASSNDGGGGGGTSGFQFNHTTHSTSTSISPASAPTITAGGDGDGAMDFSCYEQQPWKKYRREEEGCHMNRAPTSTG